MINMKPVAYVRNSRETTEDDYWGEVISSIELADGYEVLWVLRVSHM